MNFISFKSGRYATPSSTIVDRLDLIKSTMDPRFMYLLNHHFILRLDANGHPTIDPSPDLREDLDDIELYAGDDWDPEQHEKTPGMDSSVTGIIGGLKYLWTTKAENSYSPKGYLKPHYEITHVRVPNHFLVFTRKKSLEYENPYLGFYIKLGPSRYALMSINLPIEGIFDEPTLTCVGTMQTSADIGADDFIGPILDKRYMTRLATLWNAKNDTDPIFVGILVDAVETEDIAADAVMTTYASINM